MTCRGLRGADYLSQPGSFLQCSDKTYSVQCSLLFTDLSVHPAFCPNRHHLNFAGHLHVVFQTLWMSFLIFYHDVFIINSTARSGTCYGQRGVAARRVRTHCHGKCNDSRVCKHVTSMCSVCFKQRFGEFQGRWLRDQGFALSQWYQSHIFQPSMAYLKPRLATASPASVIALLFLASMKLLTNTNMSDG